MLVLSVCSGFPPSRLVSILRSSLHFKLIGYGAGALWAPQLLVNCLRLCLDRFSTFNNGKAFSRIIIATQ